MKLEFNDLGELNAFINWATHFGREDYTPVTGYAEPAAAPDVPYPTNGTAALAPIVNKPAESGSNDAAPAEQPPAEPARRKRRTKAEIEADEKAAAADKAQAGAGEQQGATQPTGANPFEQHVNTGTATEGSTNNDTGTAVAGPEGSNVVTPFQHITRGREFIGKHGLPKYNETFVKAQLDANVMVYTAEQRAKHMAVMDEMDKA